MPTTSNFGWTTPADTDFVKDGAAAIRTLGNGIDTTMVDLKGGTSGQILSKNTNADMDFVWIANDQGDITGVTAGTGISGGGTSGAVTITNSMATAIDAKGDLVVGTGSDTFSRLAVGTNDYVLTADSTQTTGVKWAAAASGGMTLISTTTANNDASIVLSSIPTTYKDLRVVLRDIKPATDNASLRMRVNGNTGSVYREMTGNDGGQAFNATYLEISFGTDNSVASNLGNVYIPDYANSTTWKNLSSTYLSVNPDSNSTLQWMYKSGLLTNLTASMTSLTFFMSSGNITSGTILLYGVS